MSSNTSLGIYFEKGRIDLVSLRRSLRGFDKKRQISIDLNQVEKDPSKMIEGFIRGTSSEKAEVYVGLSKQEVVTVHLDLPSPTEENLREVLRYELDRHTPYTAEEAYFDFQVTGRDEEKKNIKIILVVVLKKRLDECRDLLNKANLTPKSVEISSTALIKCFLYYKKQVDTGKYILIHLGKERVEFITIDDKKLIYSRSLHTFSDEKVEFLSAELNRMLLSQKWIKDDINEIVLIGDFDDNQEGMIQEFEDKMQCKTTFLESPSSKEKNREVDLQYLVAFGLALRGIENDSPPVNLLPTVEEARKERKWYVTALPLLILVLFLGVGVLVSPLIQGKEVITIMTKEIERLEVEAREMEKVENEVLKLENKLDQLMSIRNDGFNALKIFKELTEIIPSDTWITDISYRSDKIEIAGYSNSASSLIPILDNSPILTEVEFSAPVTTTDGRGERLINDRGVSRRSVPSLRRTDSKSKQSKTDGVEQFKIKAMLEERR